MKKNMGILDRGIRAIIALVIVTLFLTKMITGTLAVVLLIFAVTAMIGFCPLYTLFGLSTKKKIAK